MNKTLLSLVILSNLIVFNSSFPMEPCDPKEYFMLEMQQFHTEQLNYINQKLGEYNSTIQPRKNVKPEAEAKQKPEKTATANTSSLSWNKVRQMPGVKQACDHPYIIAGVAVTGTGVAGYGGYKLKQVIDARQEKINLARLDNKLREFKVYSPGLCREHFGC